MNPKLGQTGTDDQGRIYRIICTDRACTDQLSFVALRYDPLDQLKREETVFLSHHWTTDNPAYAQTRENIKVTPNQ
tara:strand:+ start:5759 stop:5986 length:228 start_codon:yes stop_codon:yes gene_type:complete